VRSTLYRHLGGPLYRRTWGVGYFRKSAAWGNLAVEQVTLSPYGEDPVLISLTTLMNRGMPPKRLTYVEYWDVLVAPVLPGRGEAGRIVEGLRVRRSTRYDARRLLICSPVDPFPGPNAPAASRDPDPPTIFLAAIDGQSVAGYDTSRALFFGEGGVEAPDAPWLAREAAWSAYYAQALACFDAYTNEVFFDRGGCHAYDWGVRSSPRDSCRQGLALLPNTPAQVQGTIRHLARMSKPDGSLAEAHAGFGRREERGAPCFGPAALAALAHRRVCPLLP